MSLNEKWNRAILPIESTIEQAIQSLNQAGLKIVLVTNNSGNLVGTISDGDIRRGLISGLQLSSPILEIIHANPHVAKMDFSREKIKKIMLDKKIYQIPIVGNDNRLIGLHLWDEIDAPPRRSNSMIIMAGGKGTRLLPFTEEIPKPLVEVAGKPILEYVILQAKKEGFENIVLAIHHYGKMIEDYFGDGSNLGVSIEYLREEEPLGTAGALSLWAPASDSPFMVTNGDVMTEMHYGQQLDFHIRQGAIATMAVRAHEWQIPFGVVRTDGLELTGYQEKPIQHSQINAGVYTLDASALKELTKGEHCDMPELLEKLRHASKRVVVYPIDEPWLDVGNPHDLALANRQILRKNK